MSKKIAACVCVCVCVCVCMSECVWVSVKNIQTKKYCLMVLKFKNSKIYDIISVEFLNVNGQVEFDLIWFSDIIYIYLFIRSHCCYNCMLNSVVIQLKKTPINRNVNCVIEIDLFIYSIDCWSFGHTNFTTIKNWEIKKKTKTKTKIHWVKNYIFFLVFSIQKYWLWWLNWCNLATVQSLLQKKIRFSKWFLPSQHIIFRNLYIFLFFFALDLPSTATASTTHKIYKPFLWLNSVINVRELGVSRCGYQWLAFWANVRMVGNISLFLYFVATLWIPRNLDNETTNGNGYSKLFVFCHNS